MEIIKGNQYSIPARFTRQGSPATFIQPPVWTLYNEAENELLTGAATQSGNNWLATFTVPSNYVVPGGKEEMTVQFFGTDNRGREYTVDKALTLVDEQDGYKPDGIVYDMMVGDSIRDTLTTNTSSITNVLIRVFDPFGVQVGDAVSVSSMNASSRNSAGYVYNFTIPALVIDKNKSLDPFNVIYKYTANGQTESESHPLYVLDYRTTNMIHGMRQLLDKAKLQEIDPSLQWHDPEFIQAVFEGIRYVNGSPPEITYWNLSDIPSSMEKYVQAAAAIHALNGRILAEGLNTFDFTGLNTQLNYNRTEALIGLRDYLQSYLENLPLAKKSAIATAGPGTPPPGEIDNRLLNNTGVLAIGVNPMNNAYGYGRGYGRFRRPYG
jgi:hypothetical protein